MNFKKVILFLSLLNLTSVKSFAVPACELLSNGSKDFVQCNYTSYKTINYCLLNLPLVSWVGLTRDVGDADTSSRNYKIDPNAAAFKCQQTSDKKYNPVESGYDVGHLTAIDHLDNDKAAALETNFMTNLVPQVASLNRHGAWRKSERLTECYREEYRRTTVYSGVIVGNDSDNDHFIASHGLVKTPDRFWKLIKFLDEQNQTFYTAWIFENSVEGAYQPLTENKLTKADLLTLLNLEIDTYKPVIELLNRELPADAQSVQLSINRKCHSRNG